MRFAINSTTLRGNQICQISQMLRSYFYSSSIPRDSDSPRVMTEAILFFPKYPRDSDSSGPTTDRAFGRNVLGELGS